MFGYNLDWWNNVVLLSLGTTVLAAAILFVSTRAVIVLQKLEARDNAAAFEKYKVEAEERTKSVEESAKVAVAKANEEIEKARIEADSKLNIAKEESRAAIEESRVEIAKANALAAGANERAEKELVERLKLEAKIAPRRLTGDAVAKMSAALATGTPVELGVVSVMMNPESADFADDLASALTKSGWKPVRIPLWSKPSKGVSIATISGTPKLPEVFVLSEALTAAGIEHTITAIAQNDFATIPPGFQPGFVYLLVGVKP